MRSRSFCALTFAALTVAALPVGAQSDRNLETGLRVFAGYQAGNIDTIGVASGSLNVDIDLLAYPQRGGKLRLDFGLHYENRGSNGAQTCNPPPFGCLTSWKWYGSGFKFIDRGTLQVKINSYINDAQNAYDIPTIRSDIGALHRMGNITGSAWESVDATGFHFDMSSLIITDSEGTRYVASTAGNCHGSVPYLYPGTAFDCESPLREDTNGNKISFSTSTGWTDTLGRSIPRPGTTTDYSGCTGPLAIVSATLWNLPAPAAGTYAIKLCHANVSITVGYGQGSYTMNAQMVQSAVLPDGTAWTFQYTADGYGDLAQITFPTGGTLSYTWINKSLCQVSTPAYVNRAVATRTLNPNDGISPAATWSYSYTPSDPHNITTVITDPLGNDSVHTSTGLGNSCSQYETQVRFYQGSQSTGTLLKTVNTAYLYTYPAVNPFVEVLPGLAFNVVPIRVTTIWPNGKQSKIERDYDSGFTFRHPNPLKSQTYTGIYGKVVTLREYDEGSGAPGGLLRRTSTSYLAFSNASYRTWNLLDLVSSVTVYDGSGAQKAKTTYAYDSGTRTSSGITTQLDPNPPSSPYFGNQTSVSRWLSGSTVSTTNCPVSVTNGNLTGNAIFYDTGTVQQSTDPCGHTTTFTYASAFAGAYVTQTQFPDTNSPNLAHHIVSANYDFNTGLPTSSTDENSQTTAYTYDNMLRIQTITYPSPDGGTTTFFYPDAVTVERQQQIDTGGRYTDFFVRVDGLGRAIRRITANDETTPWDQVDTCYDATGRVGFKSYPYQGTGLSASRVCSGAGDSFAYDALGRTTTVTHSDSSTILTSYTGRATSVFDEGNGTQRVQRISKVDGLGRLASVCEVTSTSQLGSGGTPTACGQDISGTGFLTSYAYDTLDNLTSVTQGTLNSRTFQYDSLSRLTSATNPESGNITYAYDADGSLITKTAPKPNQTSPSVTVVTSMTYDPLHRLRGKSYNDSLTPAVTMNYDETQALGASGLLNTIGRSSSSTVAGSQAGEVFSYDKLGRVKINSQCTPQNCGASTLFPINYTYDLLGDMLTSTNGLGVTLTYTVNRATHLTNLASGLADSNHPGTLYSSAHFNAAGSLLSASLGNGVNETRAYDGRLRLTSIAAGTVYTLTIPTNGYAPNGHVLAGNDSVNGNWTYTYDPFNRLIGANKNGGAEVYSYDYDRFGNRWHQNGPHAMMLSFSGNNNRMDGYSYDAAGNLLSDSTHTLFYDAENRIIQVDGTLGNCSTATACYLYDANGRRVRKTTSSDSVDLLYDLSGHQVTEVSSTGGWNRGEVYAGGRHVATYSGGTGGTTYFIHADWLGTERARTTATGGPYETCTSLPFGDWLTCAGPSDPSPMHFTGKERDSESGLDNFGARYDSSSLGRFMSPDSLGGRLVDPQTLNKYGYVRNNPINLIDPTGMYTCADDKDCKSKQDQAFEKARQQDLKSKDPNVVRAAKAYGDPTKDNGVSVKFGDPGNGRDANTTHDLRVDPNDANKFQAVETVTIRSGLSGSGLDAAVGHEGSHVADAQDFAATINMQGQFDASKNLTTYQTELKAYSVTQSILSLANAKFSYGDCGLNPCMLGAGIMPAQALQTINQLLANPANRYGTAPNYGVTPANPGSVLYPLLTTPK